MLRRLVSALCLGALAVVLAIQAVPYGRRHLNPPVTREPAWDSPDTRDLAARACLDCHSNETAWPWYSNVAPVSWLIQRDVDRGRRALNLSEWQAPHRKVHDVAETVQKGEMPPWYYAWRHPGAQLTRGERRALVAGFSATLGGVQPTDGLGGSAGAMGIAP